MVQLLISDFARPLAFQPQCAKPFTIKGGYPHSWMVFVNGKIHLLRWDEL